MVSPSSNAQRALPLMWVAIFGVFAALVIGMGAQFRQRLRSEVLRREAGAIHAVAQLQLHTAVERLAEVGVDADAGEVFAAVLESSRLHGVLSVQLFDRAGRFHAAMPDLEEGGMRAALSDFPTAPSAHFLPHGSLEAALGLAIEPGSEPTRVPLLVVMLPLRHAREETALGAARYWIDGTAVGAELQRMDRRIAAQVGAALLVVALLAFAFARLAIANRRLRAQSADLQRANEELDFAAKTGALGAITAHLIHGLNNPLAGIEGFVADAAAGVPVGVDGEASRTAVQTTRRLRTLIDEVATVLRDETDSAATYPVPLEEMMDAVRLRAAGPAELAGIELSLTSATGCRLPARTANLVGLILANLIANAIEASPRNGGVAVDARGEAGGVEFLIRDRGTGLPQPVRMALFRPVRSSKRGGGGVGLAISHRLARHASGDLALVRSDHTGTVFRLWVPGTPSTS